jgi:hypothetical protein
MKRMMHAFAGSVAPRWFLLGVIAVGIISRCASKTTLPKSKPEPEMKP